MGDPYELAEMVTEINQNLVLEKDRLSNQVYHYDKDLRVMSRATNVSSNINFEKDIERIKESIPDNFIAGNDESEFEI